MTRFDWVSQLRKDARDAAKHRVLRNVSYALREERKSNMALAEVLKLEDEIASLKQQLSAAPQVLENVMRNAERYRWLRNLPVDASNKDGLWVDELGGCPRRDDLDAEIDAAMLAAKPGPVA